MIHASGYESSALHARHVLQSSAVTRSHPGRARLEGKSGLPWHPVSRMRIRGVKAGAGLAPGPTVAALCCSAFPHSFTPQLGQCAAGGTLVSRPGAARSGHLGVKRGTPPGLGQTALEWP